MTNVIKTDPHEMQVVDGRDGSRIRAVYTDQRDRRYYIVDGRKKYLNLKR